MPEIYVSLEDESVEVWRLVRAEHVRDDVYRISDQPYERDVEKWHFGPGDLVIAAIVQLADGEVLAAVRAAGP